VLYEEVSKDEAKNVCLLYVCLCRSKSKSLAVSRLANKTINRLIKDSKLLKFKKVFETKTYFSEMVYRECLKEAYL